MTETGIPPMDTGSIAVMVVDVQVDFCDPEEFPAAEDMVKHLSGFLDTMRAGGYPIVYTRALHSEATDTEVWLSRYKTRPHREGTCTIGSKGAEIHSLVAPEPDDIVVDKSRYNAFLRTDLEPTLRSRGIETLVFTGIATNVCVEATAREAFSRDFWTILLSDCMVAHSARAHEQALEDASRGFGRVMMSNEFLSMLGTLPDETPKIRAASH